MSSKSANKCKECGEQFASSVKLAAHVAKQHTPAKRTRGRPPKRNQEADTTPASEPPSVNNNNNKGDDGNNEDDRAAPTKPDDDETPIGAQLVSPKTKSHTCSGCSKKFTAIRTLKRHELTCTSAATLAVTVKQEEPEVMPVKKTTRSTAAASNNVAGGRRQRNGAASAGSEAGPQDDLKEQMKGKITTRVNSLLKETMGGSGYGADGEVRQWLRCDKCPKEFKLRGSLDRHCKVVHMEGASYSCDVCHTRCADKGTLARHMYIHTGLKPYQCDVCRKQFSRKYHLFRHMHQSGCGGTAPPTYPCQVCGKMFSRNDNLREHLRIHAGDVVRKKKHVCEICKKEFHCPSMLAVHLRIHTGEKPFVCETCTKSFPSEGALKKHKRVHTGERPYECSECGARFSLKGTLNRHQRTHTGQVRPHRCHFCGKEFIQIGGLKAHLFHHTGDNGFPCDRCGKCFNRKARLEMHVRYVHEKQIKPHTCRQCGKSFVRKEDLNRHCVLHTGVKAYQCPTCRKTFAIKPSLKLHLLTHTKEEPKSCRECGRAFIRQDCLLRHMRKRHREVLEKLTLDEDKKSDIDTEEIHTGGLAVNVTTTVAPGVPSLPMAPGSLSDSIKELLSLLVDELTLKAFGWPDKPVDEMLDAVIRRCGHAPIDPSTCGSHVDCLRENCKLLFTVVIDDTAVKTLLNNHTVDEVILHVLRLAKA